ncbi:hypothetical protein ACIQXD_04965 [Streptomyces uncialis]|uniref:hypothetical protein n=1 Tax=Streptomyces uncialis TaxID=1048205 RepID=UPI0038302AF6
MNDPTITDLRRELEKARLALIATQSHLAAHAEMNAALHCAAEVFHSPLHAKVTATIAGIEHALARTDQSPRRGRGACDGNCEWAALVADLDRCKHGRHQDDVCGDSCGTVSQGNPHMPPGAVIGYDLRMTEIVMPDREHKHDVSSWRPGRPGQDSAS